jgi:hypothetical protein
MKTLIYSSLVILLAIGITGCAEVKYKKYGQGGYASKVGYSDFEIGKDKYKITYLGGVHDSPTRVMEFTYHRAKEICQEKGFASYEISNTDTLNKSTSSSSQQFGAMQFTDSKSQTMYSLDVQCK